MHFRPQLFLLFFSIQALVYGQENNIAIGTWRVHLPYQNMLNLSVSPSKIYTAASSSIFYFDKSTNELNIDSKYTGLSDVNVSALGYNPTTSTNLIGYANGNIDLIQGNSILNINDINRKTEIADKTIHHFFAYNQFQYIAGNFGLILFDLNKKEVKESYLNLTVDGSKNPVFSSTVSSDGDSIYVATEKGILGSKLNNNTNLMDYSNWYKFVEADSIDTLNCVGVASLNNILYAAVEGMGIYYFTGIKWRKMSIPVNLTDKIRSLNSTNNSILACIDTVVYQINSPLNWNILFKQYNITPTAALFDENNFLWVSTLNAGLIQYSNNEFTYFYPNGPLTKDAFRFGYFNNNLISVVGGYNSIGQKSYFNDWFNIFENNTSWKSGKYNYLTIPSNFSDFVSANYNNFNSTLYLSSFGNGLVGINTVTGTTTIYTESNSPLLKEASNNNLLIGETAIDNEGYLWVPTHGITSGLKNLHSLSPEGNWASYAISNTISNGIIAVTIDQENNKWLKVAAPSGQTGIIIFNEQKNTTRKLTTLVGEGALPDARVNCITVDKSGYILVGTDKGLAICYNANEILNLGVDLTTPLFDGFPILFDKNVLAIEVDGGNRKWVGTNDGIWLFNEDLTKVIAYFDEENSPILSDFIYAIKVHPKSGEVFFGTTEGICSYRGFSTEGDEQYSDVSVFPNPVKPGFNGYVGISGLAPNVSVKITDLAGNLTFETFAAGGTATWNVKDYNGKRVSSGVYLIFCSDKDGNTTFVSKIAIVE